MRSMTGSYATYNRTIEELKLEKYLWLLFYLLPYNRTIEELKLAFLIEHSFIPVAYNRTIEELKSAIAAAAAI